MLHESDDLLMDTNGSDSGFRGNDNDNVNCSKGGSGIEIDDTIIVSNKITLKSMGANNEFKVGHNDHFCHDTAIQSTITSSSPNVKGTEREHLLSLLPQELHSPHKTPQKEQSHKYNPAIHSSPLHHNHNHIYNHHQQQPLQPLQSQPQLQRNLSESDMKKMRRMRWAAPMLPERSTKPLTIPVEFNLSKSYSRKTAPVEPQTAPKPLVEPKNRRTPTIPVGPTLSYRPRRKNVVFDSSLQRPQQQPQQPQRKLGPTVPIPFNFSSSRSRSNNASQDTINERNTNSKSSDSLSKMVMGDKFFSFKRSF